MELNVYIDLDFDEEIIAQAPTWPIVLCELQEAWKLQLVFIKLKLDMFFWKCANKAQYPVWWSPVLWKVPFSEASFNISILC